ncbi:MAG: hypothetical protein Kow0099_26230 [Candidatus Abyssubacteria bacterium]
MFIQYCQCAGLDNFEELKKVVISVGPFRRTVLYCCNECFEKYFAGIG